MTHDRHGGGLTASVLLVVSAAIAYAIETGLVDWSWWWLALTGAPFVVYVAAVSAIAAMIRRER